jgi:hypothetical protein
MMSGLDVVFGTAGLLSLSLQLIESAGKLERLYRAAQDAPQNLSDIVLELETMALALKSLEIQRQRTNPVEPLLTRCIDHYRRGIARIRSLTDKLEQRVANHNKFAGRLYSVFKQQDIIELLAGLERSKSSLNLVFTIYATADQKQRDELNANAVASLSARVSALSAQLPSWADGAITQPSPTLPSSTAIPSAMISHEYHAIVCTPSSALMGPSSLQTLPSPSTQSFSMLETRHSMTAKHCKKRHKKPHAQATFCLPKWLCRRTYYFAVHQLQSGWDFVFLTYNVVDKYPLLFSYCSNGNLEAMQRHLSKGDANYLDMYYGDTLLEVSRRFLPSSQMC